MKLRLSYTGRTDDNALFFIHGIPPIDAPERAPVEEAITRTFQDYASGNPVKVSVYSVSETDMTLSFDGSFTKELSYLGQPKQNRINHKEVRQHLAYLFDAPYLFPEG